MRHLTALLLATLTLPALAHPGEHHGDIAATLWHLFTEPDHLAMMGIAVAIGIGAARSVRRHAAQRGKRHDPR